MLRFENKTTFINGNRCNHFPKSPRLAPIMTIPKGKGGYPRILSLAAEKTKSWYNDPKCCPQLLQINNRNTRSERREAIIIIIETLLLHLDIASLSVGTPTKTGFIDLDMKTIMAKSGLGQRRCERAILQLKKAGFMTTKQPRVNAQGRFIGLRAIRIITKAFFAWLGIDKILAKEQNKAFYRQIQKFGTSGIFNKRTYQKKVSTQINEKQKQLNIAWTKTLSNYLKTGLEISEAQKQTNKDYGFMPNWSPGYGDPVKFK